MPNWVTTTLTLTHTDNDMINRVKNSIDTGLFKEFVPIPTPEPEDLCRWCCDNWGTKWDAQDVRIVDDSTNSITLIFNTAWSSPDIFYGEMEKLGFMVDARWEEEGGEFGGCYIEGECSTYDFEQDEDEDI